jgi:hypothetical protein
MTRSTIGKVFWGAAGRTVEVHLEELGEHSWVAALLTTTTGSHGSAQYRFVARAPGARHRASDHVLASSTFAMMRWQDLTDAHPPNAWLMGAHQCLDELDRDLRLRGWSPCPGEGRHWWSRTYAATPAPPSGTPTGSSPGDLGLIDGVVRPVPTNLDPQPGALGPDAGSDRQHDAARQHLQGEGRDRQEDRQP